MNAENAKSGAGLHTLNPKDRFSSHADDYAKYRPGYPNEVIDWILDGLSPGEPGRGELRAVDIGAGTGIFSRLLAERGADRGRGGGVRVIAVEPNAAMRAAGEARADPNIEWRNGSAEATGLPEQWADLVVAAQAWHWFEPEATSREVRRVLRPGGRLALIWNDDDPADEATKAFRAVMQAHAISPRVHQEMIDVGALKRLGWPMNVRERAFPHGQRLTLEGLLGRARSASYAPKEGEALRSMEAQLIAVFERFIAGAPSTDGGDRLFEIRYITRVYLAERP